MKLTTALRLEDGEVVAFVGGKGNTSLMFRLAEEIAEAGGQVITTTTTRLALAQLQSAPAHFSAFEVDRARLETALDKKRHVLLTGPLDLENGQAAGVTLGLISSLRAVPDLTAILINADDAENEPEIPAETSLVVPVVKAKVFDQQNRLKNAPAGVQVVPFISQVETSEEWIAARETARELLRSSSVMAVALGTGHGAHPVREVHGRVTAIVLAAGRSTRMGRPKQTLEWGGGRTVIGHIVHQLKNSQVDEIVVVTGSDREKVEAALAAEEAAVRLVFNPDFENAGMARSLQLGLQAVPSTCLAALVTLGDQPQIEPEVVRALIQRWRETQAPVIAPVYQQQRGHPLLFDRSAWPGILALPPQSNPRDFLEAAGPVEFVEVDTDSILRDVDTPEDYERERGQYIE